MVRRCAEDNRRPLRPWLLRGKQTLAAAFVVAFVLAVLSAAWAGGRRDMGMVQAQAAVTPLVITTPTRVAPMPTPAQIPAQVSTPVPALAVPASQSFDAPFAVDGMHTHASDLRFYTVQAGDTLLAMALEVGLDLEETYCLLYPSFTWDQPLVIGDRLSIPAPGTICHKVEDGDSIDSIAAQYQRLPDQIVDEPWNDLLDPTGRQRPLTIGHHVRIPPASSAEMTLASEPQLDYVEGVLPLILNQGINADIDPVVTVGKVFSQGEAPAVGAAGRPVEAPVPVDWPYGSGRFSWPIYGWLTQGYRSDHRALDVAAPTGTAVTAADRGVVIRAGWNNQGYGQFVIVDHNIDYITLYAHLSEVLVEEGEVVAAGQVLGRVGSTGNSTGPHLHFEIRDFGRRTDPLQYLMQ